MLPEERPLGLARGHGTEMDAMWLCVGAGLFWFNIHVSFPQIGSKDPRGSL